MSFIELAPSFRGNAERQREYLDSINIEHGQVFWLQEDTLCAHAAWERHITARRATTAQKRPLADILIGAFATRYEGLVTRNPSDFADIFPALAIRVP